MLLVQGAGATHHHWGDRLLDELALSFDVVAYDHRGTGGSVPAEEAFTIGDLAADASALMDELGWASATVFGVSFGGVVAQELALRRPDQVDRLVLGCSTATESGSMDRFSHTALNGLIVRGDLVATASNLFRFGVRDTQELAPEAWTEYEHAALAHPVHPRTSVLQVDALVRHSTADRLATLDVPTLVIHGDTDRVIAVDHGVELAQHIPGARLQLLPAGHLFWLELPAMTARIIREFRAEDLETLARP